MHLQTRISNLARLCFAVSLSVMALLALSLAACNSNRTRATAGQGKQGQNAPAEDPSTGAREALQAALVAMFENDPETALRALDATGKYRQRLDPGLQGQLELAVGKANLAFARQRIASGKGGVVIDASFLDAEEAFRRAAKALPQDVEALVLLSETQAEQNRFDDAIESATTALERLKAEPDSDATTVAAALVTRSKARLIKLAAMRGDASEEADEPTLRFANEILQDLSQAKGLDPRAPEPYELAANTHRWLLRFEDAMRTLEDAVRAHPMHNPHHESLQGLYLGQKRGEALVGFYRKLVRESEPVAAVTVWWLGRALYTRASEVRGEGDRRRADSLYRESEAAFERSAELEPGFASSTEIYRALAAVSSARMALDEGDEEVGMRELDRAYEITERIAEVDENGFDRWFDSFSKSYRGGIYALGGALVGGGSRLDEAAAYFRKVTARHPDWGQAWNNLGLVARDYGVQKEQSGDKDDARALYEESFAAYEKAARLVPDDARIQNDMGLMLIYHLGRDRELAITQFEKAITIGKAQLEGLPSDETDETKARRRDLEEAIGDAHGNWGLALEQEGKWKDAIEKYTASLDYYPHRQRAGTNKIEELKKKMQNDEAKDKEGADRDARECRSGGSEREPGRGVASTSPRDRRAWSTASTIVVAAMAFVCGELAHASPAQDVDIKAALEALDNGDAEGALSLVERGIGKSTDAERWYCAGRGSLLFAKQQIAAQGSGVETNLIDAIDRLEKAIKLADDQKGGSKHLGNRIHVYPARDAIEAMVLKGDAKAGLELGKRHLTHLDSLGIAFEAADLSGLYGQVASAALRVATSAYQNKDDGAPKLAEEARTLVVRFEKSYAKQGEAQRAKGTEDAFAVFRAAATLEEWAQRGAAALRLWERVAPLFPAASMGRLAGEVTGIAERAAGGETATQILTAWLADRKGDAATLSWYLGYAKVLRGHELRAGGDYEEAKKGYEAARKDFKAAMTKNPGFTENSKYWIAMAHAADGAALKSAGKSAEAIDAWLLAVKTDARVALAPDSLGQSAQGGVMLEVDALYSTGKLDKAAELAERYLKELGSDDKNILNNIGFFWREFAGRQSGSARTKAYEASWDAYKRAAAIATDDPRILNDAALIDVYYLKRNPKEAERMLRQAIEAGDAKMADDPPTERDAKNALEEAIGDSYMNLGVLLMEDEKRWDEAQDLLEKSLDYYPARRASAGHLARLDAMRKKKKQPSDKSKDGGK